jgi:hypothetical protein
MRLPDEALVIVKTSPPLNELIDSADWALIGLGCGCRGAMGEFPLDEQAASKNTAMHAAGNEDLLSISDSIPFMDV